MGRPNPIGGWTQGSSQQSAFTENQTFVIITYSRAEHGCLCIDVCVNIVKITKRANHMRTTRQRMLDMNVLGSRYRSATPQCSE